MRTAQTDTSFGGRGPHGQGFLPLLGDLNSPALSSVPACLPASDCERTPCGTAHWDIVVQTPAGG